MKLINLYLQAYGKFISRNIHFSPGINLIFGNNESGKSTLADFIYSMFYGQKRQGVKRRLYNESHYFNKPWNSSLYQGTLKYSLNKEIYKIERNFHSDFEEIKIFGESGEDITNTFKLDSRKELEFFNEQIGLSGRSFKNTVYLAQNDMEGLLYKNKENILENILNRALYQVEAKEGEKSIREAIKDLEKTKLDIGNKNNKNKPLGNNYKKLEDNLKKKYSLENKKKECYDYRQSLKKVEENLEILKIKKERLNNYKQYIKNKNIQERIDELEDTIRQKEELLEYVNYKFHKKVKISSLDSINNERKANRARGKRFSLIIILLFIIEIAISLWIIKFNEILIQGPILTIALILTIFNFIKWKNTIKKDKAIAELWMEVSRYQEALNELNYLENKIQEATKEYTIDQLKGKIVTIKENIDFPEENLDIDTIERQLQNLEKQEVDLIKEHVSYQVKIKENNWTPSILVELERDIYNLQKNIRNLEEDIQAIDIGISTLKDIESSGNSKWLPDLINRTGKNIYKITKKYHTIKIDENYQIKTIDLNSKKLIAIDQLSKGTFNQFYFALRISLIQLFSPSPIKLAIILDEPFINFDNNRFKEALSLLKDISSQHQVIIFTSQLREKEFLESISCDYNYIEL